MKILVTGGAGFIGSHLVDELVKKGHTVAVIDNLSSGLKANINPKAKFFKKDIRDFNSILPVFKNIDIIFHAAADPHVQNSVQDPAESHSVNLTGTVNVLEAARRAKVKKFLFFSSCAVYGNPKSLPVKEYHSCRPLSPYGLQKLMSEQYARMYHNLYGMKTLSLRIFNCYGPRCRAEGAYPMVIPMFLQLKRRGKPLTIVGDGNQTRDFVYVSDVVSAFIHAMKGNMWDGTATNIASGTETSINKIAGIIGGTKKKLPARVGEATRVYADINNAKRLLGWSPKVTLKQGIVKLMNSK